RQACPGGRVVIAFQPHRYTRTRDLLDDFARVLSDVDALIVTEIYAAGEAPIAGADGKAICRAIRSHGRVEPVFVERIEELPAALIHIACDGDVIVTMGAGSIGALAAELPAALAALRPGDRRSGRNACTRSRSRRSSKAASCAQSRCRSTLRGASAARPSCSSRRAIPTIASPSCRAWRPQLRCSGSAW